VLQVPAGDLLGVLEGVLVGVLLIDLEGVLVGVIDLVGVILLVGVGEGDVVLQANNPFTALAPLTTTVNQ
jgi:hypothetical protein